jgi:hypothetical protein
MKAVGQGTEVADRLMHMDVEVRRFGQTLGQLCLITVLAILAGCGKGKSKGIARVEKPTPSATPAAEQSPHTYKLGEPRPIILNADKPIVVKAATITPTPQPSVKR